MLEKFESRPEIEKILHHIEMHEQNTTLQLINKLKKSDSFTTFKLNQKLLIYFYELLNYNNLGKFEQFIEQFNIIEKIYEENSDTADDLSLFILYYFKIFYSSIIQDFESASKYVKIILNLSSILNENQQDPNILKVSIQFYNILSLYYSGIKDSVNTIVCLSKSVQISKSIRSCYYFLFFQRVLRNNQNKHDIFRINADIEEQEELCVDNSFRSWNYIHLSTEFLHLGRLKESISFINQAFDLSADVNVSDEKGLILIYVCNFRKGLIYSKMGNYEEAIKFLTKALEHAKLIYEQYNNPINLLETLNIIGNTYLTLGQNDQALDYLIKGNELIIIESGAIYEVSYSYYLLILLYLKIGTSSKAESIFLKLDELYNRWKMYNHPGTRITGAYRNISYALLLIERKSYKTYSQAQDILTEIVSNPQLRKDVTAEVVLPLISLRFDEFKTFQTDESLEAFWSSLKLLRTVAGQQNSIPLKIQSNILQAKMHQVQGEFDIFEQFLDNAKELAIEYNLKNLVDWIDSELEDFQEQYQTWKSLIASDSPLINRFENVSIENYIKDVRSLLGYKK